MPEKTIIDYFHEARAICQERASRGELEYPTGLEFLDEVTGGMHPGEVWIISGRPGSGKTALAAQVGKSFADNPDHSIVFLSLEMQGWELCLRMYSSFSGQGYTDMIRGVAAMEDNSVKQFTDYLATIDYGIYEQGFKFAQLEKIIMTEYAAKKPDIIILDFIQLIDWKEYGDERIALDEYARKIKELAKTLKIGFIILSQLRRLPSGANTQRAPEQSDLKGSGGLEAVADKVILLYKTVEGDYPDERSKYFLKLDKNRQGPTLTKELLYFGRTFTFAEIARPAIKGEEKQAKLFE